MGSWRGLWGRGRIARLAGRGKLWGARGAVRAVAGQEYARLRGGWVTAARMFDAGVCGGRAALAVCTVSEAARGVLARRVTRTGQLCATSAVRPRDRLGLRRRPPGAFAGEPRSGKR